MCLNNEFVFSDGGDRQVSKAYTFRAKTSNVSMLNAFGADLANLANNHTYDSSKGFESLQQLQEGQI